MSTGMNGASRDALLQSYTAIALLVGTVDTVNVMTVLSDSARYGAALATWKPIVWEATSGLAMLVVCGIVYRALRLALPGRAPWPLALAVHGGASVLFSLCHVALMVVARSAIYALLGLRYRMALSDWPYEYRKDVLAYIMLGAIFWIFARHAQSAVADVRPAPSPTFDIGDGTKLVRVPIAEICALRAAGNYVEFLLVDGRTRLMRGSMRAMEARFVPEGFVRTHRSWLVNAARVNAITATGSGDFDLAVEGSPSVPLSRRYPAALQALRGG